MQIASLLSGYKLPQPTKKRRTERGDFLEYFYEKINHSRRRDGFKELTMQRLGFMLSLFTTEDLYHLRLKCDSAEDWGKCFNFYVFSKKFT